MTPLLQISRPGQRRGTGSAPQRTPATSNPFVPIPPAVRYAIIGFCVCYLLWVTFMRLSIGQYRLETNILSLFSTWAHFAALLFPFIFYRPSYGYAHPLILTSGYAILMMVIRKTAVLIDGIPYHIALNVGPEAIQNIVSYGAFVSVIAIFSVYLGFFLGPRLPVMRLSLSEKPNKMFPFLIAFSILIATIVILYYVKRYGGGVNYLLMLAKGSKGRREMGDFEGLGQFVVPIELACAVCLVWICYKQRAIWNPIFWMAVIPSISYTWMLSGKRSSLIYWMIQFCIGWVMRNKRLPVFRLVIVGAICFSLLGILGLYRVSNQKTQDVTLDFFHELSPSGLVNLTMEELQSRAGEESLYYAVLARVPHDVPFLYGKSYLENFYRFIPRYFWRGKPRGIDVQANRAFVGGDWGMPVGAVGEAYWNGHIPMVMFVFFLLGMGYRWAATMIMRYPGNAAVMAVYIITIFCFSPSQNGFRRWLYATLPLILFLMASGFFAKKAQPRLGRTTSG